jgi:tripartite ATP-independent transporter DctM subunit
LKEKQPIELNGEKLMDLTTIGIIGICCMLILLFLGVPIAFSMAVVGIIGIFVVAGPSQSLSQIVLISWEKGTDFVMVCIPLFVFMGQLASHTGIASDLFGFLQKWLGRLPGGLAVASVGACGAFGAVTGSSVACVATMGSIIYPEMKKYNYDSKLAAGVLASSGTLGILIPPSITFAFYGILTDTSIASLFIAGIIPGIITIFIFSFIVILRCVMNPKLAPVGPRFEWKEKFLALKGTWAPTAIFIIVVGSLYGGICTPTEASGIGAVAVILISLVKGKLDWGNFRHALWDSGIISAFVFAIIIGGYLIGRFLVITNISQELVGFVHVSSLNKVSFILCLIVLYTILGCILDVYGMLIITLPFVFPIVVNYGIDPVWFGVFIVVMTEIALITPPVGVNVFVMKNVATDVPMGTIFKGIVPFLLGEYILIVILIIFPQIATWLPLRMMGG